MTQRNMNTLWDRGAFKLSEMPQHQRILTRFEHNCKSGRLCHIPKTKIVSRALLSNFKLNRAQVKCVHFLLNEKALNETVTWTGSSKVDAHSPNGNTISR